MLDSILEPLLLVVGFQHERVLRALRELRVHPKLRAVVNERWAEGLSSSLKAALADLPEHATGVVILPGDMPLMTPQLIDRVARRFLGTGKLCFPVCQGQKGHPTAIPRALFAELWQLKGDVGAFSVVKAHWDEAERFELSSEEALTQLDIDAYEDCAHLEGR
jgi:molybdenum cofactor cytidylyltransferase